VNRAAAQGGKYRDGGTRIRTKILGEAPENVRPETNGKYFRKPKRGRFLIIHLKWIIRNLRLVIWLMSRSHAFPICYNHNNFINQAIGSGENSTEDLESLFVGRSG
jgi:hypothetical protein